MKSTGKGGPRKGFYQQMDKYDSVFISAPKIKLWICIMLFHTHNTSQLSTKDMSIEKDSETLI